MTHSDTLIIKHLPVFFDDAEKEEFLKYFGAKEVKCISSKVNKYNIAFARFESEDAAENVLHRLHQVNILGTRLSVEYSKGNSINAPQSDKSYNSLDTKEEKENEYYYKQFLQRLSSWHSSVNFRQPVPSHLKYQYPPPNMQTLTNIMKVLVTVPKFYTQVLHLMNKMNLPCPFGKDILPEIELDINPMNEDEVPEKMETEEDKNFEEAMSTSSESEISSDEEAKRQREPIPERQYVRKARTRIKVSQFLKPPAPVKPRESGPSRKTTFEEVFEKPPSEEKEPKKIKLSHIPGSAVLAKPVEEAVGEADGSRATVGFGFIHPVKKVEDAEPVVPGPVRDDREEERLEREEITCISEKELAENRVSEKDRSLLPVFKNYAEGAPTCRLYIKNLAKTVTEMDLKYIYRRYASESNPDEPDVFDIRLMQEGRMKGQAFVTLQTVELAQKALRETNGFILKEKPLVVQYARSAAK